jgi:N-acetylglucosamine-6-sulfatase
MTDDQPKDTMLAMPNVGQRIGDVGMVFNNGYVTQSLCAPSRSSILRGQYPHNTGVQRNSSPYGGLETFRANGHEQDNVATRLRASGYATALVGKYMNGYDATYTPPGWSYWYGRSDPGSNAQHVRENNTTIDLSNQPGNWGDRFRDHALGFLDRRTDQTSGAPFALFFWTPQPHLKAGDYADRYANLYTDAMPADKPSVGEDLSDKPQWERDLPLLSAQDRQNRIEWRRNQLRSLRQVDDAVGDMLDLLAQRGELSNTYVVFTTDNGTHMGEHRWLFERGAKSTAYEEAANVPYYVRGPGVPHGTSDDLVLNNDFAPTFLTIAGLTPPPYTDGRNVLPAWKGADLTRTHFLNERQQTDDSPMPPYKAVINKGRTYVEWSTGEHEFYDRVADPYQIDNAYDPQNPPVMAGRLPGLASCSGPACKTAED